MAVPSVGVLRCVGTIGLNATDLLSNVRLLGVKRTWRALVTISANDPKRTSQQQLRRSAFLARYRQAGTVYCWKL